MRRAFQLWNGWEPPPAMCTLSRSAARTTASRSARSSFTSDSWRWCTEEFNSIMLSVISGFTAPGCPFFSSSPIRSAASRARLKSRAFSICSSSSVPMDSGDEGLKSRDSLMAAALLLRFARMPESELDGERAYELHDQRRREHDGSELGGELRVETRRAVHHGEREPRHRRQRETQQARRAGPHAGEISEAHHAERFSREAGQYVNQPQRTAGGELQRLERGARHYEQHDEK